MSDDDLRDDEIALLCDIEQCDLSELTGDTRQALQRLLSGRYIEHATAQPDSPFKLTAKGIESLSTLGAGLNEAWPTARTGRGTIASGGRPGDGTRKCSGGDLKVADNMPREGNIGWQAALSRSGYVLAVVWTQLFAVFLLLAFPLTGLAICLPLGVLVSYTVGDGFLGAVLFLIVAVASGFFLSIHVWDRHIKKVAYDISEVVMASIRH